MPALFTAVPETTWAAPSVLTTTGAGHVAMPATASAQVKVTRTSALYQPAGFDSLSGAAVIVGPSWTLNALLSVTASAPVVTVTFRKPTAAELAIVNRAVSKLELATAM